MTEHPLVVLSIGHVINRFWRTFQYINLLGRIIALHIVRDPLQQSIGVSGSVPGKKSIHVIFSCLYSLVYILLFIFSCLYSLVYILLGFINLCSSTWYIYHVSLLVK